MLTKAQCQKIVLAALASKNLVEMSSGQGQDFCDALGEALYNVLTQVNIDYMLHTHVCAAPASASGTPSTPIVS